MIRITVGAGDKGSPRGGPLRRLIEPIASLGIIGGIVVLIWEGSSPLPPIARGAGALGFIVSVASDLYGGSGYTGINAIVLLVLALNCTTRQHASAQPLWLTVFGVAILAALVFGAVPFAVTQWRRRSDERDRAIANGSMAFALLTTVLFMTVFSFLKEMKVGVAMQPDWALWTAAASWFGAWFYLRRKM
jgi:amino acid permease